LLGISVSRCNAKEQAAQQTDTRRLATQTHADSPHRRELSQTELRREQTSERELRREQTSERELRREQTSERELRRGDTTLSCLPKSGGVIIVGTL